MNLYLYGWGLDRPVSDMHLPTPYFEIDNNTTTFSVLEKGLILFEKKYRFYVSKNKIIKLLTYGKQYNCILVDRRVGNGCT